MNQSSRPGSGARGSCIRAGHPRVQVDGWSKHSDIGGSMRLSRRFLPVTLALAALSVPIFAFAQDMMGQLSTSAHPTLGTILVDPSGRTVYSWQGDSQGSGTSNCNDQCAGAWPPVLID